jgi:hypothetical protein
MNSPGADADAAGQVLGCHAANSNGLVPLTMAPVIGGETVLAFTLKSSWYFMYALPLTRS